MEMRIGKKGSAKWGSGHIGRLKIAPPQDFGTEEATRRADEALAAAVEMEGQLQECQLRRCPYHYPLAALWFHLLTF